MITVPCVSCGNCVTCLPGTAIAETGVCNVCFGKTEDARKTIGVVRPSAKDAPKPATRRRR